MKAAKKVAVTVMLIDRKQLFSLFPLFFLLAASHTIAAAQLPWAHKDQLPRTIQRLFPPAAQTPSPDKAHATASCRAIEMLRSSQLQEPSANKEPSAAPKPFTAPQQSGSSQRSPSWEERYQHIGPGFGSFLATLTQTLARGDRKTLLQLLHPRIRGPNEGLGFPWPVGKGVEAAIEGIWATHRPDRSSKDTLCHGQNIYLSPQYGYPLQFFIWTSLTSQRGEIYRVMSVVVPFQGRLHVAALHGGRWTHSGKDAERWIMEADGEFKNQHFMSAYIKYDVARKLLYGASHFRLVLEDKIKAFLKNHLSSEVWQSKLAALFPQHRVVAADSLLSKEGVGLMLRFALPEELSSTAIRAHCNEVLSTLKAQSWFAHLQSVRCGYNLPHEKNHKRDGLLGSIHLLKKNASP